MDIDVATQRSILWRTFLCFQGEHDLIVLALRYQAITQTTRGMRGVWVTDAERKIVSALVIFGEDVEGAFRGAPISLSHFVANRARPQSDAISPQQLVVRKQEKLSLTFLDQDSWLNQR